MQTRHKDGAGLFKCNLSGFDSFIWPALLPPEAKEAKTISATWRQWRGVESQEETTGCCSFMAKKLLVHFESLSALKRFIR